MYDAVICEKVNIVCVVDFASIGTVACVDTMMINVSILIDGLVQGRLNSSALVMELCLFYTNPPTILLNKDYIYWFTNILLFYLQLPVSQD